MAAKDPLKELKALVVDDQQEARSMLRNMLTDLGITQVFESPDGRNALTFVDNACDFVNIVICDWNMPSLTGIEFLRQLRSVDPNIPFLMITGRGDMESVVEAKASGVTGYIRKPYSPAQLEAKLRIIVQKVAA